MKLKCDAHKRRVFALNNKFIHRTDIGDGTFGQCDSPTATIGDNTFKRTDTRFHQVGAK